MKKILILVGLAFSLLSCSKSPSSVAENFANAIGKGEYDEAKKYCTETTATLVGLASLNGKKDPNYSIEILRDSIVGDKAWVFYKENGKDRERSLTLKNIDGEWKVDIETGK